MGMREQIDFSVEKLQSLADKLSLHFWNKSLTIPVVWNGRLTRAMGRFVYQVSGPKREPLKIEVSKYAAKFIDRDIFIAVLLHELCHYHLFIQNKPCQDHHPLFEQELRRVGAISTNSVKLPEKYFRLFCVTCGKSLGNAKRINPHHYRSSCCHGEIRKEEVWSGTFSYDGQILKNKKVRIIHEKN